MNQVIFLIPIALFLGLLGLAAFVWSLRTGQYDDLQGAAERILDDDDEGPGKHPRELTGCSTDQGVDLHQGSAPP